MNLKRNNIVKPFLALVMSLFVGVITIGAQCETFKQSGSSEEAENAYVIYRGDLKIKNMDGAFEMWKKTYELAPAADGRRYIVYTDGVELYKQKMETASETEKATYKSEIVKLYDSAISCMEGKSIILPKCTEQACIDEKVGFLYGRKAFDMFYTLNSDYPSTFIALDNAIKHGGNTTEYIVLEPFAFVAVNQFAEGKLDKAQTREYYNKLNAIADHNISNNAKYKAYYESAKARMNAKFDEIAMNIFDCAYFVKKMKPQYEANPTDLENLRQIIATLKRQACQKGEPFLDKLEAEYSEYAEIVNTRIREEFEANNPGILAKKAYDAGDFSGAIDKYKEAIRAEDDPGKKAGYYFSIASIQFRKLKRYTDARRSANLAAELRPDWGRPYMLIGDMYASSSRSCGKDGYSRGLAVLAAINMYRQARSVDPGLTEDANSRISKYRASIPPKDEVFMRGMKKGQRVSVPCWIGGTVALDYR
ncbi:MAG: tetratricopeptide repeat protein [Bacteroidia bacterium]|nr:tetratricopeptide repeat protein [Bacteroidia bacterium]